MRETPAECRAPSAMPRRRLAERDTCCTLPSPFQHHCSGGPARPIMAVQSAKGQRTSLSLQVIATAAVTALSFLMFETGKEFIFTGLSSSHAPTRWESHIYTIVFGTLVASGMAYL